MSLKKNLLLALAALLAFAGISFAQACASYGQDCGGGCCGGLVCNATINICTQPNNFCTNMPGRYVRPPEALGGGGGAGGPVANITSLVGGTGIIGSGSGIYQAGWFSDWNTAGLIGVAIAILIAATAAMAGQAFNLPEVKAFADTELMQAVVSVLLIGGLIALVGFFDYAARAAFNAGGLPITCVPGEPCYITAAKFYLGTLYSTADGYAKGQLTESIVRQASASRGISFQLNWWMLLYAGTTIRPNAGMSIDAERAASIFEVTSKLMASLYAQRYFIDVISYGIAPVFLLLGIVLRTFFFARRLGGLLLAIAISLFIIYPITYAFVWYTLNVTVYGERTFGGADPACPNECTARYPVAFFINSTNGSIVQFETTQEIMLAGITTANWASGGPGGKFPGLVACRNLTKANVSAAVAPNECPSCPDYCRDVPFPTNLPGCNIGQCASCNPGCKIMRQRSDCELPEVCSLGNCPISCRTKLPVENKCFFESEVVGVPPIRQADLSVSCIGCSTCPNWCRFLTNVSGTVEQVYKNDVVCTGNPACKTPAMGGTCPQQCQYLTEVGKSSSCNSMCTDASTGVMCPKYCRVNNLPGPLTQYDVDPPNLTRSCFNDPQIAAACSICPPGCKTAVPVPPLPQCAGYPSVGGASAGGCLDCPEYCRFADFAFITPYSFTNVSGGVPNVCLTGTGGRLDCSSCDSSCKKTPPDYPLTCREYSADIGEPDTLCRKCPADARMTLEYVESSTGTKLFSGPPELMPDLHCDDVNCGSSCRKVAEIPNALVNPACQNETAVPCPYGCRVTGINAYLSASCSVAACTSLPAICKVAAGGGNSGIVCSEYIGNGDPAGASQGQCYGMGGCDAITDPNVCRSTGCIWAQNNSVYVPIIYRNPPFDDTSNCKQCPENCRINGYAGDCGLLNNTAQTFTDCSASACANACRIALPPPSTTCQQFNAFDAPCQGCPALCRRDLPDQPPGCSAYASQCGDYEASTKIGCSEDCRLAAPSDELCSGCFECPLDCTYYPGVRTDCSDICSDESLAGPVSIAPDDFIKALPGAAGATDVKGVGTLMVPALVMPLFCIVIVIAFISVFSPILGGDMEIPGLSRII